MNFNSTQVLPSDLPEQYHTDWEDGHSFAGVDLRNITDDYMDELYGILASPEDIPTVVQQLPDDLELLADAPCLLSHTQAFHSKFDVRELSTGRVATQINFGSIPADATVLDLRANEDVGCFTAE